VSVSEAVTLIAAVAAAVASIGATIVSVYAALQGAKTHELVNGQSKRLEQLAHDQGVVQGEDQARQRAVYAPAFPVPRPVTKE